MALDIGPTIHYYLGAAIYVIAAIFGIILGSFLNSWIWRARENIKIVGNSRSMCIHCRRVLKWWENIPLVSFLRQNGECGYCHKKIPVHYFLVELITPILMMLVFRHCLVDTHFSEWTLMRNIFFLSLLIIIFKYDWLYREVLPEIVWAGAIIGFFINYFNLNHSLFDMAVGAFVAGGFFLGQYLISRGRWIGGGDVRLGFMFGIWLGWQNTLVMLFVSYILGALVAVGLILTKRADRRAELPFATFLTIGTFVALLYGNKIVEWYLNLLA